MKLFIGVCILFYLVQCEATNGFIDPPYLNINVRIPESNILNVENITFEVDINQRDRSGTLQGFKFPVYSTRRGAFNSIFHFDVDTNFYPIKEIHRVKTFFKATGKVEPSSWIRKYTVVLETRDGYRAFIPENPQQKVYANKPVSMKVVPETAV